MRIWQGRAVVGDYKAVCDRCGWDYLASDLREEWTGLMVCRSCWEIRHPQDFVRGVEDDPSVPWTRPASDVDDGITYVSDTNTTLTSSNDTYIIYQDDLTANRTVTLDTADFKNGDRFQVKKDDGTSFTLDIDGLTTLSVDSSAVVEFNGVKWQLLRTFTDPL